MKVNTDEIEYKENYYKTIWDTISAPYIEGFRASHKFLKEVDISDIAYFDSWKTYKVKNLCGFKIHACTPELLNLLKRALKVELEKELK